MSEIPHAHSYLTNGFFLMHRNDQLLISRLIVLRSDMEWQLQANIFGDGVGRNSSLMKMNDNRWNPNHPSYTNESNNPRIY